MATEIVTRSPAFVDGRAQNAQELRLHVLSSAGGATPLASRGGVRPSGGSPGLVAALATPVMKVRVNAGIADVPSTSVSGGFYRLSWDQVDLDIDPSSAQARTDLVIVEIVDTGTAAATGKVRVLKGSSGVGRPSNGVVNAHWLPLASVPVRIAAESSGNIRPQDVVPELKYAVAAGADIPVSTQTERDALTRYVGLAVRRLDDGGRVERWTGGAWAAPGDVPVLATIAARNTYFAGNLRAGASALVAGNPHVYDGAAWRFRLAGYAVGTTDANGLMSFPHGAGQAPMGRAADNPGRWQVAIPPQPTDGINNVVKLIAWSSDATNLTIRAVRTDSSAYFGGQPVNVNWDAQF